jgi:GNAT superfamily N-acetyltransferase
MPRVELERVTDLTAGAQAALRALSRAVYPPDEVGDWPGRRIAWASPEWGVLVHDDDGALVSYTGIVVREAALDGAPVLVGGIGSVKTHPAARGRGLASVGLDRAERFLVDERGVAFSLLVCQDHLVPFYERLGWHVFEGTLLVEQPSGTVSFTFNRPMVQPGRSPAPRTGTLDLKGMPW